jgi:hypothetical protein
MTHSCCSSFSADGRLRAASRGWNNLSKQWMVSMSELDVEGVSSESVKYVVCKFTDLLEVGLRQARRKAAKCCEMGGGGGWSG